MKLSFQVFFKHFSWLVKTQTGQHIRMYNCILYTRIITYIYIYVCIYYTKLINVIHIITNKFGYGSMSAQNYLYNKLWLIIRGSTKAPKSDNLLMQFHSSGTKEEFDDGICETWVCHDPILFVCFFLFFAFWLQPNYRWFLARQLVWFISPWLLLHVQDSNSHNHTLRNSSGCCPPSAVC